MNSSQNDQQDSQNSLKINSPDFPIDPNKQSYFKQLLEQTISEINQDSENFNLSPLITGNSINYQYWYFFFKCDQGCFAGKQIGGVLKFPPDFPDTPPRFYFDPLPNGEVIQHECIYANNQICLPLFFNWNPKTSTMQILRAIQSTFINPNWKLNNEPANPGFWNKSINLRDYIQQLQAETLPLFQNSKEENQQHLKKQSFFKKMMEDDQENINLNELNYSISPKKIGNSVNYQYWQFSFKCNQGGFAGKQISGVLIFPPDFPTRGPNFYFDLLPNAEFIQHENIHFDDSSVCLPILHYWDPQNSSFDVLQAIEYVFNNPNQEEGKSSNPKFSYLSEEERKVIQQAQAQFLPTFEQY